MTEPVETCLGRDMDCGRPLPCPDHPGLQHKRHYDVTLCYGLDVPHVRGMHADQCSGCVGFSRVTGRFALFGQLPGDWEVVAVRLYDGARSVPVMGRENPDAWVVTWIPGRPGAGLPHGYLKLPVHCGPPAPLPDTETRRSSGA